MSSKKIHNKLVNQIRKSLVSGVALCALLAASPAYAEARIGTSAAVRGKVFVTSSGRQKQAAVKDQIFLEDKVVTKTDSALQILLLDASLFTVGQNCEMKIDRFVYDPDSGSGNMAATVAKGAFRFMSGRIGKDNPTNASIKTPAASIGIRGTFFEGIVGEDAIALAGLAGLDTTGANPLTATIVVLKGPGPNNNTLDNNGQITVTSGGTTVTISQPNYFVFVPYEGAEPIGPFPVTQALLDYLDFLLRSRPEGPQTYPVEIQESGGQGSGQNQFNKGNDGTSGFDGNPGIEDGNVQNPPPPPPPPPPDQPLPPPVPPPPVPPPPPPTSPPPPILLDG